MYGMFLRDRPYALNGNGAPSRPSVDAIIRLEPSRRPGIRPCRSRVPLRGRAPAPRGSRVVEAELVGRGQTEGTPTFPRCRISNCDRRLSSHMRDHPDAEPGPSGLGCQQDHHEIGSTCGRISQESRKIGSVVGCIRPESHKRQQRFTGCCAPGRSKRQPSERGVSTPRLIRIQRIEPFGR